MGGLLLVFPDVLLMAEQSWDRAGPGLPCGDPSGPTWSRNLEWGRCFQFQDSAFLLLYHSAGAYLFACTLWQCDEQSYIFLRLQKKMCSYEGNRFSPWALSIFFEENICFHGFSEPQGVHASDLLSGWEVDADRFLGSHKSASRALQFFCTRSAWSVAS